MKNYSVAHYKPGRTQLESAFGDLFNQTFDMFFKDFPKSISSMTATTNPKVNAYKKDDTYVIDVAVPFAKKEDLSVTLEDNVLTISVAEHQDKDIKNDDYIIRQISRSASSRSFALDETVDTNSIETKFENGVLNVTFKEKQKEVAKSNKVNIEIK